LSAAAIYGPFVAAAIYALAFESSSNVSSGMWQLLPWAPGLLHVEATCRIFDIPRPPESISFAWAFVSTLFTVFAQAWVLRQVRWLGYVSLAGSVLWFSFCAIGLMALLRA